MKAVISTAILGLAFGAQDDELWSLFPKAGPAVVTEPTQIIENNQNSAINAVKMNQATYSRGSFLFKKPEALSLDDELWSLFPKADPTTVVIEPTPIIENNQNSAINAVKMNQATYSRGSFLFKKPEALALDDDNELWSLFPKAETTLTPVIDDPMPVIVNNQDSGMNAVKMNQATYSRGSFLFKKPAALSVDDELFAQSAAGDSQLEVRFLGNLNRFFGKAFQPKKKPVLAQEADDELMNLDALINDALQAYNDARQPKKNYGQLVNDAIQIVKDLKKH